MVQLEAVRAANAALVKARPLVGVFFGGTAGIGECAVRSLASAHGATGRGLRVYIVGRNQAAADKIISECQQACPPGRFRFVQATDLGLLKEVDRVCGEITRAEEAVGASDGPPRVDFLVLTQGILSFSPKPTSEGLDTVFSLSYYSRMRAVVSLLPLLLASPGGSTVVTVMNPKMEQKFLPDDPGLRQRSNFGLRAAASHAAHLNTLFMQAVAARHPGKVSLVHYFPGLVKTDLLYKSPLPGPAKLLWKYVVGPISSRRAVPLDECGARVVFLAAGKFTPVGSEAVGTDGTVGSGAYRVDWDGETFPTNEASRALWEAGVVNRAWEHTMATFEEIATTGTLKE